MNRICGHSTAVPSQKKNEINRKVSKEDSSVNGVVTLYLDICYSPKTDRVYTWAI